MVIGNLDEALHRGLEPFPGHVPVYVSPGLEGDIAAVVGRIERAHRFYVDQLGIEPRVAVLILGPDDWAARSNHPLYGMPNYRDGNLVLAGEPNPFWTGLADLAIGEVPGARQRLAGAYADRDDTIDLSPFFDLLGVHELAHVFIEADGRVPSRFWVLELACNVLLHAYVVAEEPEQLPTLEAFPAVLAGIAPSRFTHRTLEDFERSYAYDMDGANYGWFQTKFHVAAKQIYDVGGPSVTHGMWSALAEEQSTDLEQLLAEHLGAPAVELLRELSEPRPDHSPRNPTP
jgi:hypothetical protein